MDGKKLARIALPIIASLGIVAATPSIVDGAADKHCREPAVAGHVCRSAENEKGNGIGIGYSFLDKHREGYQPLIGVKGPKCGLQNHQEGKATIDELMRSIQPEKPEYLYNYNILRDEHTIKPFNGWKFYSNGKYGLFLDTKTISRPDENRAYIGIGFRW